VTTPRLVLIDGHSLIHRSFHALKDMPGPLHVSTTGELTFGVYGFANTFLAMFGELNPTHVVVALDMPVPTFRHEITDTYKATRVGMPQEEREEFKRQFNRCRQLIETFGMPIFELERFEADDIMGTLAAQAAQKGIDTYLVSMDSDIAQLVGGSVHLWMYRPYQRDSVVFKTEGDVVERYGVLPLQVPDLKALKGDTSDNIPGVPGVGDKTAIKLVQTFGEVEAMLERIDEVQPAKLQPYLRENGERVRQSKLLATIVRDAPATLDLDAADFYAHFDRERVLAFFRELEFRTLGERLPQGAATTAAVAPAASSPLETHVSVVRSQEELDALAKRIAAEKAFVLDVETRSREAMRADIVGLAIGLGDDAYYLPVGHAPRLGEDGSQLPLDAVLSKLGPLLADPEVKISGHYLKPDIIVLARHGVWPEGFAFDTMLATRLFGEGGRAGKPEEGALSLTEIARQRLGLELPERSALLGSGTRKAAQLTIDQVEIERVADVAAASVAAIGRLRAPLAAELEEKALKRLFEEIELPLVSVVARMEMNGVAIDTGALREMSESLVMEVQRLEHEIYASVGHEFNIGSPQQLSHILFEELHLPKNVSRRLKTGAYSTDSDVLEALRGLHDIIEHLFEYREITKLKSTYLDPLPSFVNPQTNRVHGEFNQVGSLTGRFSSTNPNLQNIPVRTKLGEQIRRSFVARDVGPDPMLLSADYSQIELRIIAHITQDPNLVESFRRDEDIHASTASQVFSVPLEAVTSDMRRRAKVFNFGVLYGLSEHGLAVREKISREDAAAFIRTYFEKYPGIRRYTEETVSSVRSLGYGQTLFGRRRYFPEINSTNFNVRGGAEREAINMPVQGTAADIIKTAMNRLDAEMQRRRLRSLMILQIHDELIFECPQEELDQMRQLCLDIMPSPLEMAVPLKIDTKTGRSWGDMQYGDAVEVGEFA